jgi:hypothetical protein
MSHSLPSAGDPIGESTEDTAGVGSPTDPDPGQFGVTIAGYDNGDIAILLSFQDVRWHFTAAQAEALGSVLGDAARQARQLERDHAAVGR